MSENPYSVSEHQTSGDIQSLGPQFDSQLRVMQIIATALMTGVLLFLGLVLVITKGNIFGQGNPGIITLVAVGFAGLAIVNHVVIPGVITKAQLNKLQSGGFGQQDFVGKDVWLLRIYQMRLIVALALLEGAAFFNLVAMMVENHLLAVIAVIVLLALMVIRFPTKTKVIWWVQDRMRELP